MTFSSDDALAYDDTIHEMDEFFTIVASRNSDCMALHKYFSKLTANLESSGRTPLMNDMTQNSKIIAHLKKAGSITVREALIEYSVQSLTKRINELRNMGHNIQSIQRRHPITKQRYVRYHLMTVAA